VRGAGAEDVSAAVAAIRELLSELGGSMPSIEEMEAAAHELLADPRAGLLLLAEQDGEVVGVLAASYQLAIHTAGRYALLQDLWVKPSHRSGSIGAQLVQALCEAGRERGLSRVEVGLPKESFAKIEATRSFYVRNGFQPLGPRMRLPLT
jgi:GNAT superfamily N-acetyltransferase